MNVDGKGRKMNPKEIPSELQYMNEPRKPYPPSQSEFEKEFEEQIIYTTTLIHEDADEDIILEEFMREENKSWFNHDEDELKKALNIEGWGYDNDVFSLQKLLSLASLLPKPRYDPNNIFIRIHRDRQIDYVQIQVVLKVPTDKERLREEYNKQYVEYLEKTKKYDNDMKEYKEWKKKLEIEECKLRLKKLENE